MTNLPKVLKLVTILTLSLWGLITETFNSLTVAFSLSSTHLPVSSLLSEDSRLPLKKKWLLQMFLLSLQHIHLRKFQLWLNPTSCLLWGCVWAAVHHPLCPVLMYHLYWPYPGYKQRLSPSLISLPHDPKPPASLQWLSSPCFPSCSLRYSLKSNQNDLLNSYSGHVLPVLRALQYWIKPWITE